MFFSSKHLVFFPVGFLLYTNLKINKSHHLFEFYSGFHRPSDVFQSLSNGYEKQNKKKQKQDKTKQKKQTKKNKYWPVLTLREAGYGLSYYQYLPLLTLVFKIIFATLVLLQLININILTCQIIDSSFFYGKTYRLSFFARLPLRIGCFIYFEFTPVFF